MHELANTADVSLQVGTGLYEEAIAVWTPAAARRFREHRSAVPDEVWNAVFRRVVLPYHATILELGCGPGLITPALSRFGRVFAVDPNMAMLREAHIHLSACGVRDRVTLVYGGSQELDQLLQHVVGGFDLVVICRAFFVMDKVQALRRIDAVLRPGGTVVIVDEPNFYEGRESWQRLFKDVILDELRDSQKPSLTVASTTHRAALSTARFRCVSEFDVVTRRTKTVDHAIRQLYSGAFGAFGSRTPKRAAIERSIRLALHDELGGSVIVENPRYEVLLAQRDRNAPRARTHA